MELKFIVAFAVWGVICYFFGLWVGYKNKP